MKLLPLTLLLALAVSAKAQNSQQDSIHTIKEVVITARLTQQEIVPSQSLKGAELQHLNSQSVADALRYFSGIQLKDYGGVGGIKTVDIRSMGTHHLGIFYDGIELGNAQNGQIDLGQFSLDNIEEISLYNGQKSAIFQPASQLAAGPCALPASAPDNGCPFPFVGASSPSYPCSHCKASHRRIDLDEGRRGERSRGYAP